VQPNHDVSVHANFWNSSRRVAYYWIQFWCKVNGVRQTIFTSMLLCTVYLICGWLLVQLFSESFIGAFTSDDQLLAIGTDAIKS